MDLKSQLWTPPPPPYKLSFTRRLLLFAPVLARSRLVCRPLPPPRPWGSSLNLASDSTDLPPNEDLASHPLGAPHPHPCPESRLPGPRGALLRGLRARPGSRGGREAQGGRVVAPQQPPGPPRSPRLAPLPQQMPSTGELYLKNPGGHMAYYKL